MSPLEETLEQCEIAIAQNYWWLIQRAPSGLHPLDWCPLLIVAAVFWAALG